jgi:hypothetical protein
MIDTSKHLWIIPIPDSKIRDQVLFHATQDPERAAALAKEEDTVALKVWLEGSFETWGHVTRWEQTP